MSATPCSRVRFRTAIPWPRHNSWPVWYVFICWNTAAGEMMCSFRDHVSSHSFSLLMRRTLRGHEKKMLLSFPWSSPFDRMTGERVPGFGETKGSLGLWSLLLLFRGEYKRRPWLITAKCASCLAKFRSSRKKPTHSSWFAFWSCHYHNAVCHKLNASTGGWEQGGVLRYLGGWHGPTNPALISVFAKRTKRCSVQCAGVHALQGTPTHFNWEEEAMMPET